MAIVVTAPVVQLFDPNVTDASGGQSILAAINNADPEAARLLQARPFTFVAEGQSIGTEAVTIALLAPVNLTLLGVTFPASSVRLIRTRVWSRRATVAQAGFCEVPWLVVGGATPSVLAGFTVAAGLTALNDPQLITGIPNNNDNATTPNYGKGIVVMDPVATTNVIVGVQNILGTTNAPTTATLMRWRLEVFVDTLVSLPVAA